MISSKEELDGAQRNKHFPYIKCEDKFTMWIIAGETLNNIMYNAVHNHLERKQGTILHLADS